MNKLFPIVLVLIFFSCDDGFDAQQLTCAEGSNYNIYWTPIDFINLPLLIHDYQSDGITMNINKIRIENPIGFFSYYFENIISNLLSLEISFTSICA